MLEACERIVAYTADARPEELQRDLRTLDAVIRNLEVLGEAAKRVSPAHRALAPQVPWRAVSGMRDVLIHDYFGVDVEVVCDAAMVKVPELLNDLRQLLERIEEPSVP
jgi:uncharacterized protein with HEPN domain